MKMPRSFRLGLHRIAIKRPHSLEDEENPERVDRSCKVEPSRKPKTLGMYTTDAKGKYSYRNHQVEVVRELGNGLEAKEILHHELGHAVWDFCGLNAVVPQKWEEAVISVWTHAWLQMMRDNPSLREYLYEDEDFLWD